MGKEFEVKAFTYLPRQDKKADGIADKYIYYASSDGKEWRQVASGEFANIKANPVRQVIPLMEPVVARYFKFSILHVLSGNEISVAELGVHVK